MMKIAIQSTTGCAFRLPLPREMRIPQAKGDLGGLTTTRHQLGASRSPSNPAMSSHRYDDQPNAFGAMTDGRRLHLPNAAGAGGET
ncbi:MAG: hypothetical protein HY874_02400 [Chloroflexi bacterium]|nr:hypothetical protein [Chloroflexota bacterium]